MGIKPEWLYNSQQMLFCRFILSVYFHSNFSFNRVRLRLIETVSFSVFVYAYACPCQCPCFNFMQWFTVQSSIFKAFKPYACSILNVFSSLVSDNLVTTRHFTSFLYCHIIQLVYICKDLSEQLCTNVICPTFRLLILKIYCCFGFQIIQSRWQHNQYCFIVDWRSKIK